MSNPDYRTLLSSVIMQSLGEASALFMKEECRGTEIIMPTQELIGIGERAVELIHNAINLKPAMCAQATGKLQERTPGTEKRSNRQVHRGG